MFWHNMHFVPKKQKKTTSIVKHMKEKVSFKKSLYLACLGEEEKSDHALGNK